MRTEGGGKAPSWGTALATTLEMPIAAMAMARVVVKTFIVFCFGAWICETGFVSFLTWVLGRTGDGGAIMCIVDGEWLS